MTSYKALLACGVAAAVVCVAGQADAQTRDFNVPAQSAVTAIPEFARQARVQIIASARDLEGVRTRPVVGEMGVREALQQLIAGTPLQVASDTGSLITLRSSRPAAGIGSGTLTGTIVDPATGDYLRNAIIKVDGRQVATSGDRGEYRVNGVRSGDVQLSVEFTGYTTVTAVVAVPAGGSVERDIELRSSLSGGGTATEVAEVVVVGAREGDARAIMEQRASMNIVNTLSAESFGEIGDGNPAEFLKYMPGVDFDVVADDVPRKHLPARAAFPVHRRDDQRSVACRGRGRQHEHQFADVAAVQLRAAGPDGHRVDQRLQDDQRRHGRQCAGGYHRHPHAQGVRSSWTQHHGPAGRLDPQRTVGRL